MKPGPLDDAERKRMRRHPQIGHRTAAATARTVSSRPARSSRCATTSATTAAAIRIGLAGEDIPIEARVVTVADVFDALISPRPYKEAWSIERALDYIEGQSGKLLDPACVQALDGQPAAPARNLRPLLAGGAAAGPALSDGRGQRTGCCPACAAAPTANMRRCSCASRSPPLFAAYLGWEVSGGGGSRALYLTWWILLGEWLLSLGLLAAIVASPGPSDLRRWIGMLADYAAMGGVMHLQGETAAPLYAVFLWVTIGNGMRYGPGYLFRATALAGLSFAAMMRTTPYWLRQPYLSWGLLIGLVAVPLYFASLLKALTARDRGSPPRQPSQEPLPGQHEPRVPHAAQRPVGDVGTAGQHAPGQRAARLPGDHPGGEPLAAVAGRGRARHLRDRGRQAEARSWSRSTCANWSSRSS